MGFTTGLLGGFTLTTSIIYLSLSVHNQTRLRQAALLNQQTHILTTAVEPQPALAPPRAREVKLGVVETAKDIWNAELEREVRVLQGIDWNNVWNRVEEGISSAYRTAFQKGREAVPEPPVKS